MESWESANIVMFVESSRFHAAQEFPLSSPKFPLSIVSFSLCSVAKALSWLGVTLFAVRFVL